METIDRTYYCDRCDFVCSNIHGDGSIRRSYMRELPNGSEVCIECFVEQVKRDRARVRAIDKGIKG